MDKLFVKSFNNHNEYLDIYSKERIISGKEIVFKGWFKYVNGVLTALYVDLANVYFYYDKCKFEISEIVKIEFLNLGEGTSLLKLFFLDNEIKIVGDNDYSLFNIEPFDYIDEEDFNWELYLFNIINNSQRQSILINSFNPTV